MNRKRVHLSVVLVAAVVLICGPEIATAGCNEDFSFRDFANWCGFQARPSNKQPQPYDPKKETEIGLNKIRSWERNLNTASEVLHGEVSIPTTDGDKSIKVTIPGSPTSLVGKVARVGSEVVGSLGDGIEALSEASSAAEKEKLAREQTCGDDETCKASVERQWQKRNLDYAFSPANEDSALMRFAEKTLDRVGDNLKEALDGIVGNNILNMAREYENSQSGLNPTGADRANEQMQLSSQQIEQQYDQRAQDRLLNSMSVLQNTLNTPQPLPSRRPSTGSSRAYNPVPDTPQMTRAYRCGPQGCVPAMVPIPSIPYPASAVRRDTESVPGSPIYTGPICGGGPCR